MKLVSTTEDSYIFPPSYVGVGNARIIEVVSPRITQVSPDEASLGGVAPRADSFRAVYVSEPFAVVSIRFLNRNSAAPAPLLLAGVQLSSSITTFDTFTAGGQSTSVDTYNLDTQCLASMGRFSYNLENYATSQIVIKAINRTVIDLLMIVKIEVYSRSENQHTTISVASKNPPSNIYTMKASNETNVSGNRRSK